MNHFVPLVNSVAASWSDALVRASWQGGLVIALIWLACRLWPGMPPVPRCWLWRLAYAKLLLGLVWLPPLALPLLHKRPVVSPTAPTAAPQERTPSVALPETPPVVWTAPASALAAPPSLSSPIPVPSRRHPILPTVQTWLLTAWLLGAIIGLGRVAAAWRRAHTLYDAGILLADEALDADVADLCRRLGLRRVPPLRVTDGFTSPLLLGWARPVILLPAFVLSNSPRSELRLMLAHELAHFVRRDLLWNTLPLLAQRLFFFHPLVWLAEREWSLAQEIACDALAVQVTDATPSAYGRMLLSIATRRTSAAPLFPTLAVAAPRHTLRRRLFAMQHLGTVARPRTLLAAALVAALAIGGLLPWRVVAQAAPSPSTSPTAAQGDAAWEKQDQKQQADIASKNAQLDAQLAEIQKHLPPAQSKKVRSWIASFKAEYAKEQKRVEVSEQSRAAYVASHPNRLSDAQIAFVQQVNWDKMHHKRISENVQAEYAAIPKDQRDRVALLRSYSLEVSGGRMFALIEKEAAVSVLQQRLAGKLPARQQSRGAATKAPIAPPHASTASPSALALSGPPSLRVAQFTRGTTGAAQPSHATPAPVQISPVMAEALGKVIAQLERQRRATDSAAHRTGVADEGTVIAYLKARRAGASWAQASITAPEFNPGGLKGQKMDNMRRLEQQAQQDKYIAEKYVFLLAVKRWGQENLRRIAPRQDQRFRQMKNAPRRVSAAPPDNARARTFQIEFRVPPRGTHRVRVLTQDATGQHLILDKLCQAGEALTLPTTAHGNRVGFLIYDNGKLIKNQAG